MTNFIACMRFMLCTKPKAMKFLPRLLILMLVILTACQSATTPAPTPDKRLQTTPPSRLYFKNIRSSSYLLTTQERTQTDHYRLRNWPDTAQAPFLVPVIIDNWLYDQAYLDLQWVAIGSHAPGTPFTLIAKRGQMEEELTLPDQRWGSQHDFGLAILAQLMANAELFLRLPDRTTMPIFTTEDVRSAYRITLTDYRHLTDK